jgi:putative ABC transport system permease protein
MRWFLLNSEDVGDMASMIWIALFVGFGVTGVMLYMFTEETLGQYAVLNAMGATPHMLLGMILAAPSSVPALVWDHARSSAGLP